MAEEGLVLGRNEGVDDQRRIFVIGQLDPPFAGEGLDRIAVVAAHVARQRRLIGKQFLRRRQPGGEKQPDRGKDGEAGRADPGQAPHPNAFEPRVDPRVDAMIEGDQIGKLPER